MPTYKLWTITNTRVANESDTESLFTFVVIISESCPLLSIKRENHGDFDWML